MKILLGTLIVAAFGGSPFVRTPAQEPAKREAPQSPPIYDENADARADIAAALAHAKKENRRVLIEWGKNTCSWCVALHATLTKDKDVARKLLYEYDVVRVAVDSNGKNLDVAKSFGLEVPATPFLTILDAEGRVLVHQRTTLLERAGETAHDPRKVLEFLGQYEAVPLDARKLYDAALERAQAEQKRVFVHFGAPW